jgi:polyhydroxyalkanoate synthase
MSFPIQIQPSDVAHEASTINQKLAKGIENLNRLRDGDVDIGSTPKDTIFELDRLKIYHYKPLVEPSKLLKTPMVIVPPLINGYEVADLQPDRSLVRNLLNEGIDVYLINWGYPKPADKYLTIDDYVESYLDECVDFVRDYHDTEKVTVLGICQGGTLSTMYSCLHPDKVANLVLTVSPIDFHAYKWTAEQPHIGLMFNMASGVDVDTMVQAVGNVPADQLNVSFLMAAPFNLAVGKYADLIDIIDDEKALLNFLRMEKWLFGGPAAAGTAYRQFVKEMLQENRMVRGELELRGRKVDMKQLKMPILSIYAERDHLVPPACTVGMKQYLDNKDYTELCIKTGHIGIYTGGASQKILAPAVGKWLRERAN